MTTGEKSLQDLIATGVDDVERLLESGNYSGFDSFDGFHILGLRRLRIAEECLGFESEIYLLKQNAVYTYNPQSHRFCRQKAGIKGLLISIEAIYTENRKVIDGYASTIETLEEHLFSRNIPSYFLDMWFDLKRDLSRIGNYYFRNAIVYREFTKKASKLIVEHSDEFKDIEESIQFQNNTISSLVQRLESLHGYYASIKADRLNKTLLMLTVISGIFLPLNLLVGFFGMNTEGMFLHGDPKATEKVVFILAGVFVAAFLGIRIIRLIDHFFLKFLLGRYDFYKSLTKRLDEIDERLKGK